MRLFCFVLLVLTLPPGCGIRPGREPIPYRFRQSLLGDEAEDRGFVDRAAVRKPVPKQRSSPIKTKRPPRQAAVCRWLRGRTFRGPRDAATLAMLGACLGRSVPPGIARARGTTLHRHSPETGDIVLFHNTRDANNNSRVDDRFTDAGVVVGVEGPRVRFFYLHPTSGAVREGYLNLRQPNRRRLGGATIHNTFLRVKRREDPAATRYLAGQLLAGFVRLSTTTTHRGRL